MQSKHVLVLALAAGLAACGGGGGRDGGGGGDGGSSPRVDYSGHYRDLGMQPEGLPDGLSVDAEVASAVVPGYLGFGMLLASLDLRMALQSYEWTLRGAVEHAAVQPGDYHPSHECFQSGRIAVFERERPPGSGYGIGEEVRFGFADCMPSSGKVYFRSDGPEVADPARQTYRQLSAVDHLFEFDTVRAHDYPGLLLGGGPLVRHEISSADMTMSFSNAAPGGLPGTLTLAGAGIRLYLQGADRGITEPSVVHTRKASDYMFFDVDHLAAGLERGSALDGGYVLRTRSTLEVDYSRRPRLLSGSFEVARPASGEVYRFELDADPAYLRVEIDEHGDGSVVASGRISQALVIGRYRLDGD